MFEIFLAYFLIGHGVAAIYFLFDTEWVVDNFEGWFEAVVIWLLILFTWPFCLLFFLNPRFWKKEERYYD